MRFLVLFLFFVSQIHSHIEELDQERKPPQSVTPFAPILVDYDDSDETTEATIGELSPPPQAAVYMGRRSRRAIHDPVADYLDEKASNAIFSEKQNWGPPSIPPYNYIPTSAPTQQEFSTTSRPEIPPYTQPPSMTEETNWSQTRPVEGTAQSANGGTGRMSKPIPPTGAVVSYDLHVDPDFPMEPPRARGLSEGGPTDAEFSSGYRWKGQPRAGGSSGRNYDIGPRGRQNQGYGRVSQAYSPPSQFYSNPSSAYSNPSYGYSNPQSSFGYSSGSSQMASPQSYFVPNSNFYALAAQVAQQSTAMSSPPTYSSYGSYSPLMSQASSPSYGSTWSSPTMTSSYVQPGK